MERCFLFCCHSGYRRCLLKVLLLLLTGAAIDAALLCYQLSQEQARALQAECVVPTIPIARAAARLCCRSCLSHASTRLC